MAKKSMQPPAPKVNPGPGRGNKQIRNNLPNWLNVFCVSAIFATAIYGAIRFMDPSFEYVPALGIHNFRLFFPAGIVGVVYAGLLFTTSLFTDYDLATVMFLILLVVGLAVLSAGVFAKAEADKVKFFEVASA